MKICRECSGPILSKYGEKYCSQSCACTARNKLPNVKHGRSPKPKICKGCQKIHLRGRLYTYCSDECKINYRNETFGSVTKSQLFKERTTWQCARSAIQDNARKIFFSENKFPECVICGYAKHVEVCHIKSVSDFDENSKISVINAMTNLIGMCPNHHWEFDSGLIDIQPIIQGIEQHHKL